MPRESTFYRGKDKSECTEQSAILEPAAQSLPSIGVFGRKIKSRRTEQSAISSPPRPQPALPQTHIRCSMALDPLPRPRSLARQQLDQAVVGYAAGRRQAAAAPVARIQATDRCAWDENCRRGACERVDSTAARYPDCLGNQASLSTSRWLRSAHHFGLRFSACGKLPFGVKCQHLFRLQARPNVSDPTTYTCARCARSFCMAQEGCRNRPNKRVSECDAKGPVSALASH